MKYLLAAVLATLSISRVFSQTPTFSENIAAILYKNCTTCHREGGIAPFKLVTYEDVYARGPYIKWAVSERTMPPWPPDPSYRQFMHERLLDEDEINAIVQWVDGGMPRGNPQLAPPHPQFPAGSQLGGTPDLTVRMPVYASQASLNDEYTCFAIPSRLTEDKFIRAIEVVPGNLSIVHHVIVFAADSGITDCTMSILAGQTLVGYAPGAPPTVFPSGDELKLGMKLKAGSNIMLQLHYPKGTAGELDSTSVNFYFYPNNEAGIREVISGPYIQNFIFPPIQPNTIQTVEGWYTDMNGTFQVGGTTREDRSLLAVFPHMHLIGKSIISYAIDPSGDTIPLININNWDFEWQGFYFYKNLIKIPAGSSMQGRGVYDNTTANPHNPYRPPQAIPVGESTTEEMFLISYLSLAYQPGDEGHDLERMMALPVSSPQAEAQPSAAPTVYPNPSSGFVEIRGWKPAPQGKTTITITNMMGQPVFSTTAEAHTPLRISTNLLPRGVYILHLQCGTHSAMKKIVFQ